MTPTFKASKAGLLTLTLAATMSLSACATSGGANAVPIIDAPNSVKLQSDLGECQQLAAQRSAGNHVLGSALVGAGFGALVGSSFGGNRRFGFSRRGRGENALAGALAGGAAGTGVGIFQGQQAQADIVYRCMAGRGYRILG